MTGESPMGALGTGARSSASGPTALVTGCSSGFGRALVTELLGRGYTVFATLRRLEERRSAFDDERRVHGERLRLLELDVTRAEDRDAAVRAVADWGRLDLLVNNAGYGLFGAVEDLDEDQVRHQVETGFLGPVLLTRALLPYLRAARGAVFNVSSVLGYSPFPLTSMYCATKAALEGWSEALWLELRPLGVRVVLVEPGGHRTHFGPNVQWGRGQSPAFALQTRNYRALKERVSTRPGSSPPGRVAARIAALAGRPDPPLRVRIGAGAVFVAMFQAWVPGWMRLPLLDRMMRRLFLAGGP